MTVSFLTSVYSPIYLLSARPISPSCPAAYCCIQHACLLAMKSIRLRATQDSKHESAMASINVVSVGSMRPKGKSYDIEVFQASADGKQHAIYTSKSLRGIYIQ